ncbi:MAG TPA: DUF1289 domain-containing protein [Salinarimonas sp.]|nr:DUF1289 domain-containing protein [Salinarimonas sp.]
MNRISSPCIRVCTLDPEAQICIGCGRSAHEITRWYRLTEEERLAIMATLEERLRRLAEPASERDG